MAHVAGSGGLSRRRRILHNTPPSLSQLCRRLRHHSVGQNGLGEVPPLSPALALEYADRMIILPGGGIQQAIDDDNNDDDDVVGQDDDITTGLVVCLG